MMQLKQEQAKARSWKRLPNKHPRASETVKLIRKLGWVRLEEKMEQLEKELEQHAIADMVVSTQYETD
jgi:hypothetical protein